MMALAQETDPELWPLMKSTAKAARDELLPLITLGLDIERRRGWS
jgi:hypothetical protein